MGTAASSLPNPIALEAEARGAQPTASVLAHRARQRRQTLAAQVLSYGLGAAALLIYAYAGTISMLIPSAFFLCGVGMIGIFAALSEIHVSDRFPDHHLAVFQTIGHV